MELQGAGHQAALGRWAGNPLPLPPFLFPLPLLLCGLCTHWVPALHILENLKRLSFSLAMMEWLGSKQLCLLKTISHVLFFCSLFLFFKFIFNWRIIDLQHCLAYHSVNQPSTSSSLCIFNRMQAADPLRTGSNYKLNYVKYAPWGTCSCQWREFGKLD